ncbi:hypothetical protein B0H14DRAFT_3784867 [Mycena olivaceomarginata]|nr:hypothetical protein B0H14DRAFT_3784867 [Mycena olivaceomarginata]
MVRISKPVGVAVGWVCATMIVAPGVSPLRPLMEVAGFTSGNVEKEDIRCVVGRCRARDPGGNYIPLLESSSPHPSILLVNALASAIPALTRTIYASSKAASPAPLSGSCHRARAIAFTHLLSSTIEGDLRASAVDGGTAREADPNKTGLKRDKVARRCIAALDHREKNVFMPWAMGPAHLLYWSPFFDQLPARSLGPGLWRLEFHVITKSSNIVTLSSLSPAWLQNGSSEADRTSEHPRNLSPTDFGQIALYELRFGACVGFRSISFHTQDICFSTASAARPHSLQSGRFSSRSSETRSAIIDTAPIHIRSTEDPSGALDVSGGHSSQSIAPPQISSTSSCGQRPARLRLCRHCRTDVRIPYSAPRLHCGLLVTAWKSRRDTSRNCSSRPALRVDADPSQLHHRIPPYPAISRRPLPAVVAPAVLLARTAIPILIGIRGEIENRRSPITAGHLWLGSVHRHSIHADLYCISALRSAARRLISRCSAPAVAAQCRWRVVVLDSRTFETRSFMRHDRDRAEPHPHRRPRKGRPKIAAPTHAAFFELKNPLKVGAAHVAPLSSRRRRSRYLDIIPSFRQPLRAFAQISAEDTGPHVPSGWLLLDWRRPSDVSGAGECAERVDGVGTEEEVAQMTMTARGDGDVDEE